MDGSCGRHPARHRAGPLQGEERTDELGSPAQRVGEREDHGFREAEDQKTCGHRRQEPPQGRIGGQEPRSGSEFGTQTGLVPGFTAAMLNTEQGECDCGEEESSEVDQHHRRRAERGVQAAAG